MRSGKVLLGVLAGLAAGALLGVLFAPDKGSVTRKKLSETGEDYARDLQDKFNEFIESLTDKYEETMEDGENMVRRGKKKAEEAMDNLEKKMK